MSILREEYPWSNCRNDRLILLINCSKSKRPYKGRADEVYSGPLVQLGLQYATKTKMTPLILSTKYGIIRPSKIIEPYDEKFKVPYDGPWPHLPGYWIGSQEYFLRVPSYFQRFFPKSWSYGQQKGWLMDFLNDKPHEKLR